MRAEAQDGNKAVREADVALEEALGGSSCDEACCRSAEVWAHGVRGRRNVRDLVWERGPCCGCRSDGRVCSDGWDACSHCRRDGREHRYAAEDVAVVFHCHWTEEVAGRGADRRCCGRAAPADAGPDGCCRRCPDVRQELYVERGSFCLASCCCSVENCWTAETSQVRVLLQ